jgi:DNA gyrase subunit A
MISCKSGVTIRMGVSSISAQGRATQGVKLIRLDDGDEIAAITKLDIHVGQEPQAINLPGEVGNPDLLNNGDQATGDAPESSGEENQ